MRISIIGSGAVGRGIGAGFHSLGRDVVYCDVSEKVVKALKAGGLKATTSTFEAVKDSEVSFICVPTPSKHGRIDLSCVRAAAEACADALKQKRSYHVFVLKSTVVPGTTEKVLMPALKRSGKRPGRDFGVVFNPEFLTVIEKTWTKDKEFEKSFFNEDRIVLGAGDRRAAGVVEKLYKPLRVPVIRTDYKTAEMIKYAANMNLAARVAINNEFYQLCKRAGVDGRLVAGIVALDRRIGKYGSVCGKAFGGTCFKKDLEAIIGFAKEVGYDAPLLKAMKQNNDEMRRRYGVRE